jgi:hypothetical protein
MRGNQPARAVDPPGADFGRSEILEAAQDEAANGLLLPQLAESARDLPGAGRISEVGDERLQRRHDLCTA